ncbi:hypothetical protein [Bacillus phage vB_BanS-Thrax5]|nr:hypothetical protein [Bacillus phage vB_BanS-Thrax5]
MKNLMKKIGKIGALVGMVAIGYFGNDALKDDVKAQTQNVTPVQEMSKEEGFNIATIPDNRDNIFTQYFTITRVMDNVVEARNTFYENDYVFLEKTDFDKITPSQGMKIAVTYNHDTVVTVTSAEQGKEAEQVPPVEKLKEKPIEVPKEQPKKEKQQIQKGMSIEEMNEQEESRKRQKEQKQAQPKKQEKPVQTKQAVKTEQSKPKQTEYTVTENTKDKLVKVENGNDKAVLENDNYKKGDKVKVTFGNSGAHDDIQKQEKVESEEDKAYREAFEENARTDINRNNPNYVQTEDGSYVPKNFWD